MHSVPRSIFVNNNLLASDGYSRIFLERARVTFRPKSPRQSTTFRFVSFRHYVTTVENWTSCRDAAESTQRATRRTRLRPSHGSRFHRSYHQHRERRAARYLRLTRIVTATVIDVIDVSSKRVYLSGYSWVVAVGDPCWITTAR